MMQLLEGNIGPSAGLLNDQYMFSITGSQNILMALLWKDSDKSFPSSVILLLTYRNIIQFKNDTSMRKCIVS